MSRDDPRKNAQYSVQNPVEHFQASLDLPSQLFDVKHTQLIITVMSLPVRVSETEK
jgi:hypothetical protein